jgi:hypothetical protein
MVKLPGLLERYKKPLLLMGVIILATVLVLVIFAVWVMCSFFYMLGSIDDPFRPQMPGYYYTADVTGLEDFTTANGSAMVMLPLPAVNRDPILQEG